MAPPKKTHCVNGHPKTPENVTKGRNCKICMAERVKVYREENRDHCNAVKRVYHKRVRAELQDQYLNALIHGKTGLPASEITDEDRKEFKGRVQTYRDRKQHKAEPFRSNKAATAGEKISQRERACHR